MSKGYGALRGIRNLLMALLLGLSPVLAQPVTVAALGDSLTAGYGLPAEDGFVPQLQAWLDARDADVTVLNAGVSGDTTQGGLARINWTLTDDVDAVIVALGGNDMLRGIDPAVVRDNLAGILTVARGENVDVLLVGMKAPGNYGADYKQEFDAIYPDLARDFDPVYVESFLEPLAMAVEGGEALTALMQPDGLHPNADGVALIVEAMGPHVLELIARVR